MAASRLDSEIQSIMSDMWREACDKGAKLRFRVASGSMSPLLEIGDVVTVSKVQPHEVRVGDVVVFQDGQNVVVHRIISKSLSKGQLTYCHMGDAGVSAGKIEERNLIGIVTAIEKDGHEIRLDSRRGNLSNRVFGRRLQLVNTLGRMQNRRIGSGLRAVCRPGWRSLRHLLLWRL